MADYIESQVFITRSDSGMLVFAPDIETAELDFAAGKRQFSVNDPGQFVLAFVATNFLLADPPIGWPDGKPDYMELLQGWTNTQFKVADNNNGEVQNQTARFLIHPFDGGVIDPTVINNPDPPAREDWLKDRSAARTSAGARLGA